MNKNKKLKDLEEQIRQCVKCGVCQAHCPAYRQNRKEGDVARGKIALAASLLDGKVGLEERLEQDISMCLMCGSCVNKCPNKVDTPGIVGAIRREVTDEKGLSLVGKTVSTVIHSKSLLKIFTKISVQDNEPPRCPDFFKKVCFIMLYLTVLEIFSNFLKLSTFFNNLFF